MNKMIVTEKNIYTIAGMLRKFFDNKNHTDFISWHNFDCGWSIKPYVEKRIYGGAYSVKSKFAEFDKYRKVIHIGLCCSGLFKEGFIIELGDAIVFAGNKIMIRMKWDVTKNYNYLYEVFQVNK